MGNVLVATTSTRDIRPLGFEGQLVIENWAALRYLLDARLGPPFAALLTEPIPDPARGDTDWYGEVPAEPATGRGAGTLRDEFRALAKRCDELAQNLIASTEPSERQQGQLLRLALTIPDESFIRAGRNGPILVGWGHQRATSTEAAELTGKARTVPRAAPSEQVAPAVEKTPPSRPAAAQPAQNPPPSPRDWRHLAGFVAGCLALFLLALLLLDIAAGGLAPVVQACRRNWWPLVGLAALLLLMLLLLRLRLGRRDVRAARRLGTGTGALQVILAWNDINDLDLHVFCPDGGHISFEHPSASGGRLDLDANARRPDAPAFTTRPLENIFWSVSPPPGAYRVVIDPYEVRTGRPSPFRVTVRLNGRTLTVRSGVAAANRRMQPACEFVVPPP